MVHIGKLIEEELRKQERSVTWFAKQLCCERTNVYSIFKRESIDTQLLYRISLILKKNFFYHTYEEIEKQIR
ncbi:MAG: XRE family transcriptional regulator [Bacteroidaceae bacterium]|nr:XRE family transcriptional regulator [Bacteroidaceae bacterium]